MRYLPFNYVLSNKQGFDFIIHFYIDDYQFARVWNRPEKYLPILAQYKGCFTPDFSIYPEMDIETQKRQVEKGKILGQKMLEYGVPTVIPTITWSDIRSYEFCFDDIKEGSVVTVSTMGCVRGAKYDFNAFMQGYEDDDMFSRGYRAMMETIKPSKILVYGRPRRGVYGNVEYIQPFYSYIQQRIKK